MSDFVRIWPELVYEDLAPTVAYLNRMVQVAGKYTLDEPFEVGWGNVVLDVTPRGLRTPTLRQPGVTFSVHYRLLDADVLIEADTGTRTVGLGDGTIAAFHSAFCEAARELGINPPGSSLLCEIPGAAATFDEDQEHRRWDGEAAGLVWRAFELVAGGLEAWQAAYLGHRPRVGVMWGGFDLSATRYCGRPTLPRANKPPFMQNGELQAYVSVGFFFGSAAAPAAAVYAYIWPQPDGLAGRSWGVEGAEWNPEAGLVLLPWSVLREQQDPHGAVVSFGEAVYRAAVELADWPSDLIGPRCDGWHMSRTRPAETRD
jgi:Family of unknown function (DUF5996)